MHMDLSGFIMMRAESHERCGIKGIFTEG